MLHWRETLRYHRARLTVHGEIQRHRQGGELERQGSSCWMLPIRHTDAINLTLKVAL